MLMPVTPGRAGHGRPRPEPRSASPAPAPPTTWPGQAFSFVSTLDGVGPWPPIQESHVEMDGAWALYEAWVKLQLGDVDTALVYCYGKSSPGPLHEVLSRQLDPYHVGPAVARRHQPGRPAGPRAARRRQGHARPTSPRSPPAAARRPRQPERPAGVGPLGRGPARRGADRRPAAQARLPADHRRRLPPWSWRPATRPASCASARPGSAASTTASSRWPSACATSPTSPSTRTGGREGRRAATGRSTSPSCTRPFTHQELILREALGPAATTSTSTPPAGRWPPTR